MSTDQGHVETQIVEEVTHAARLEWLKAARKFASPATTETVDLVDLIKKTRDACLYLGSKQAQPFYAFVSMTENSVPPGTPDEAARGQVEKEFLNPDTMFRPLFYLCTDFLIGKVSGKKHIGDDEAKQMREHIRKHFGLRQIMAYGRT